MPLFLESVAARVRACNQLYICNSTLDTALKNWVWVCTHTQMCLPISFWDRVSFRTLVYIRQVCLFALSVSLCIHWHAPQWLWYAFLLGQVYFIKFSKCQLLPVQFLWGSCTTYGIEADATYPFYRWSIIFHQLVAARILALDSHSSKLLYFITSSLLTGWWPIVRYYNDRHISSRKKKCMWVYLL